MWPNYICLDSLIIISIFAKNNDMKEKENDNDPGVNLIFVGKSFKIMGILFEKGTLSWLPTDEWEKIKHMTDWEVIKDES